MIGISDGSYKDDMGASSWRLLYQSGRPIVDRTMATTKATI
jgi:hypothetical protein